MTITALTHLTPTELHYTVASMERHGGGFCRALANAWYVADPENRARIETAFVHLLGDYAPGSGYYRDEY